MEYEGDGDTNYNWGVRNGPQSLGKETGRVGNRRTCQDHLNYNIIKNNKNTGKSPGDMRRLALSQTPVKDHQLMLV